MYLHLSTYRHHCLYSSRRGHSLALIPAEIVELKHGMSMQFSYLWLHLNCYQGQGPDAAWSFPAGGDVLRQNHTEQRWWCSSVPQARCCLCQYSTRSFQGEDAQTGVHFALAPFTAISGMSTHRQDSCWPQWQSGHARGAATQGCFCCSKIWAVSCTFAAAFLWCL